MIEKFELFFFDDLEGQKREFGGLSYFFSVIQSNAIILQYNNKVPYLLREIIHALLHDAAVWNHAVRRQ